MSRLLSHAMRLGSDKPALVLQPVPAHLYQASL